MINSAETILNEKLPNELQPDPFVISQQSGILLKKYGTPMALNPGKIANKESKKIILDKIASHNELPIDFEVGYKLENLLGISELIKELRDLLFNSSKVTDKKRRRKKKINWLLKIINKNKKNKTLNVILVNNKEIDLDENILVSLVLEHPAILKKYLKNKIRIDLLIKIIESLDEANKKFYKKVLAQLKIWQEVLKELLPKLTATNQYQELEKKYLAEIEKNNAKEERRLKELITGQRAVTSTNTTANKQKNNEHATKQLKTRVRNTLLKNSAIEKKKDEVDQDFSDEFLKTTLAINEIRVIARIKEAGINLVDIKNQYQELQAEYQNISNNDLNKQQIVKKLNEKLINLLIPIGNIVSEIFLHDSATTLSIVLSKEKAVCGGKVNVLLAIFKFLGINAKDYLVIKTMNGDGNHVACEISLFDRTKLVIDANFQSHHDLRDMSDEKLLEKTQKEHSDIPIKEIGKRLELYKMLRNNSLFINLESDILIYATSPEKDNQLRYKFIHISSEGRKEVWYSTIPHPHLLVSPDRNNQPISSSSYLRLGSLYQLYYEELGLSEKNAFPLAEKYYKKVLEINPNDLGTNFNLATLYYNFCSKLGLRSKETLLLAEKYYKKVLEINPDDLGSNFNLGLLYYIFYNELRLENKESFILAKKYLEKYIKLAMNKNEETEVITRAKGMISMINNYLDTI